MKKILLLLLVTSSVGLCAPAAPAPNSAAAGFEKLRTLVGDWEGEDAQGGAVKTSFKPIVSNTALMETLAVAGMEEMMTFYSVDGDGIALVHYCPTNNQPRMRALPGPGDVKELVFSFQGAGNLPSLATGHEHKLVIQFEDENHITERWTWQKNGKDTEMVYRFRRKGGK